MSAGHSKLHINTYPTRNGAPAQVCILDGAEFVARGVMATRKHNASDNAQYIVKACNAFPQLVSVIESLCDELESYCENCETVAFARDALANAQGDAQ